MDSLQTSEAAAAAVAVAPRVRLCLDIEERSRIASYNTGARAFEAHEDPPDGLKCFHALRFGHEKRLHRHRPRARPASPANFNSVLGQKFWPTRTQSAVWPLNGLRTARWPLQAGSRLVE